MLSLRGSRSVPQLPDVSMEGPREVNYRTLQESILAKAVRGFYLIIPLLVLTFILVVSLRRSIEFGRLSMPPLYDDVVYLFYAQSIIHAAAHQSFFATAHQFIDQHSPLTTLLGAIGYRLIPNGDIGPYIVSSSHILLYLIACAWLLRRLPASILGGVVCAVGSVPLLRVWIVEFRPEPAWGTLTSVSAIAFFALNPLTNSRKVQILVGLLAGLAVISKPTTAPVTILLLSAAFVVSALVEIVEGRQRGAPLSLGVAIRGTATVLTASLLIVVPIGAVIGHEIYDYIVWVMRDVAQQVSYHGNFREQALFYVTGPGGQLMMGRALPACLTVWVAGIIFAMSRKRAVLPRVVALFALILVSYAIPSASAVKVVWFGSAFYAIFVLATVYLIALLWKPNAWSASPAVLRAAISTSVPIGGLALLLISNLQAQPSGLLGMNPAVRNEITGRTEQIWDVLRKHELLRMASEPPGHISNVMTIAVEPIVGTVISLYGVKQDLPIRNLDLSYARSVDELLTQLPGMDYVVVGPSYTFILNGAALGDALRDAMDARPGFSRIATLSIGRGGSPVIIYERKLP